MKLNHILYPAMFGCLFSLYSCVEDKMSMRQQREQELENGLYAKTMVDFQTMDQE